MLNPLDFPALPTQKIQVQGQQTVRQTPVAPGKDFEFFPPPKDFQGYMRDISGHVRNNRFENAFHVLKQGVHAGVFTPNLGERIERRRAGICLDFHAPNMRANCPRSDHPAGISLDLAKVILLHHLKRDISNGSTYLERKLIVGYHGMGRLKNGLQDFIRSDFFKGYFPSFHISVVPDAYNEGQLNLLLKHMQHNVIETQ